MLCMRCSEAEATSGIYCEACTPNLLRPSKKALALEKKNSHEENQSFSKDTLSKDINRSQLKTSSAKPPIPTKSFFSNEQDFLPVPIAEKALAPVFPSQEDSSSSMISEAPASLQHIDPKLEELKSKFSTKSNESQKNFLENQRPSPQVSLVKSKAFPTEHSLTAQQSSLQASDRLSSIAAKPSPPRVEKITSSSKTSRIESISSDTIAVLTTYEYAGFWLRFFALLLDASIVVALCAPVFYSAQWQLPNAYELMFASFIENPSTPFVPLSVYFIYCFIFESSSLQATPGKLFLGLRVKRLDHEEATPGNAALRTLLKVASGLLFNLGFLLAGFTARKQALHDLCSSQVVVRKSGPVTMKVIFAIPLAIAIQLATLNFFTFLDQL